MINEVRPEEALSVLLSEQPPQEARWTFLSNHTHVLVCLSSEGDPTVRDIALRVGITERAVLRILSDLEQAGVLAREREGRRNRYRIDAQARLRHPLEAHCRIGDILSLVAIGGSSAANKG